MWTMQVRLWWLWLCGLVVISLSFYATHRLHSSSSKDGIRRPNFYPRGFGRDLSNTIPKVTIFSAPAPFVGGPVGERQSLAIRSWLALSPRVTAVLFSQHPSVSSFAAPFGSRVLVDPNIDFTFLGTPFFHSMVERSRIFTTDISVFIHPETIVLPDLNSTLSFAHRLDHDWLLVASLRNISYFPFHVEDAGLFWLTEDGRRLRPREEQEILGQNWHSSPCEDRMILAWNSENMALHNGVLPPFWFGKGIHNQWLINEAVLSGVRFVFDASSTIMGFYLNDWSNKSVSYSSSLDIGSRSWEDIGNSHLGALYGSLVFHKINFSSLPLLMKCADDYHFVRIAEDFDHPSLQSPRKERHMACIDSIRSQGRLLDCSVGDQFKSLAPLEFPFSLESLLSQVADKNQIVVLAVAGYSYKDMLMSWVCRLRRLSVTNFLICALDQETYEFSILQGLPVFYDPSAPSNISYNDCHFGTKCFQRVTKVKSRMVLKILKLGYNVLLSDVDVYWFKSPLPLLSSFGHAVLAAQSDEYNNTGPINLPRRLNSGFYFARSDGPTIAAMEKVVKHAATSSLSEQPSFYDTLCGEGGSNRIGDDRCMEPETNLTIHFLDRNLFPNGAYLDLWQKNVKAACMKMGCLVLHNNWISGRMKKLERQILSGLWEYDNSKRMCLQSQQGSNGQNWLVSSETCFALWAMLKAFAYLLRLDRGSRRDSRRRKGGGETDVSLNGSLRSRNIFVRIVHAGGREELYQYAVPASQLMEKYPGMCVARPEVFKNPQESLLYPEESLLPGHKYLIIPTTTARKLKHKHMEKVKGKALALPAPNDESSNVNITSWDAIEDISEESVCSAKKFYSSKDGCPKYKVKRSVRAKKPFVPPLPKARSVRGIGWAPSLTSVQEVSP